MESLPFGNDELETQPLTSSEMKLLADSFNAEEPELPSEPPTVPKLCLINF